MGLVRAVKRYTRRLAKRFIKEIKRKQLNIATDQSLVATLKIVARELEIPIYVLCEHCLQLGIAEVYEKTQDEALKDQLCRHLVRDHLLTPVIKPQSEPISRRLVRLKNAMSFLRLVEIRATPEEQKEILKELMRKASEVDKKGTST